MLISGELNQVQLKALQETISKLDMPAKKKQRLLWRIAKYGVIASIKRYVKRQSTPDGEKFEKRKSKRKAKLLARLPERIGIREYPEESAVKLFFKGKYPSTSTRMISVGAVAKVQHHGMKITQNKDMFAGQKHDLTKGSIKERQVKKLRALGHTHLNGKRKVKSSAKWLSENLSEAQAGVTIRNMLKESHKSSWDIKVPSRVFMGINDTDFLKSLKRELRNIDYGWDVKAQDMKNRGKK